MLQTGIEKYAFTKKRSSWFLIERFNLVMYPNKIYFMIILMNNILFISDLSLCCYCRLCTNYCPQLSNKLILVGLCSFARHLFYHLHHIGRNSSYCMDRRFSNLYHVRWNPCNFCRSSQCHWWPKQCLVSHIYF